MAWPGNNQIAAIGGLLFPRHCIGCGITGSFVCPLCDNKIITSTVSLCPICKTSECQKQHSAIRRLWSLADYHDSHIAVLITEIKYKYVTGLIEEFWRIRIKDFCRRNPEAVTGKFFIPIPLHHQKLLRRGFNQSALIAEIFAQESASSVNSQLLLRRVNNPPQAELSGIDRLANVRGIFAVNYRELAASWGRELVLIDDVYTTGSTALEAAAELSKFGFKKIDCIVLAVSRA